MVNLAVLVGGSGSNLQAVMDACDYGLLKDRAKVVVVVSSNSKAYALERASKHNIPTIIMDRDDMPDNDIRAMEMMSILQQLQVDLVVLAGYMQILSPEVTRAFENRIINIHPSLIPKHCGMGFFGIHVHEAVIAAGEKISGATVHIVDDGVDTGEILIQREVEVHGDDTPQTLQKRVLETEHEILVLAIDKLIVDMEDER